MSGDKTPPEPTPVHPGEPTINRWPPSGRSSTATEKPNSSPGLTAKNEGFTAVNAPPTT
jgi:hypothetical protein